MFYLFANSWGWLAVALAVGLVVGFVTTTRAQKEFSGGWVILIGALFLATGFIASFYGAFSGRSALFVDAALLLATAYAIGLPLGGGAKLFAAAPAPERPAKRPQIVVVRGKTRESEREREMLREPASGADSAAEAVREVVQASAAAGGDDRMETPPTAVEIADAPAARGEQEAAPLAYLQAAEEPVAVMAEAAEEPVAVMAEAAEIAAQGVTPGAAIETAEPPTAVIAAADAVETFAAVDAPQETLIAAGEKAEQQPAVVAAEAVNTSAAGADPEQTPTATSVAAKETASPIVVASPAPATAVGNGSGKKPAGARPDALEAPRGGKPDDLSKIKGVGPKSREKLHALGVFHYDQIAAWTPEQARWIGGALGVPGRVERGRWVAQAKNLAGGKTQAQPE